MSFKKIMNGKIVMAGFVLVLALALMSTVSLLKAEKKAEAVEKISNKAVLGVMIAGLSSDEKKEEGVTYGIRVSDVVKDEAAEKAGIKKEDIILSFNDEKMRRPEDLIDEVQDCKPGDKVKIKISREGKEKEFNVTLGEAKMTPPKAPNLPELPSSPRAYGFFGGEESGYLGVNLQELNNDLAPYFGVKQNEGALILNVEEESPAQEAGLKSGDVIIEIDGKPVKNPKDVSKIIAKGEKGDKIDITILRHQKKNNIKAQLDERKGFGRMGFFNAPNWNMEEFKGKFLQAPEMRMHMPAKSFQYYLQVPPVCDTPGEEDIIIMKKEMPGVEKELQKKHEELMKNKEMQKKMQKEMKNMFKKFEMKEYSYI